MNLDEVEAQALKLDASARARLATKLLASLEVLTDDENLRLWAEEAERRDSAWEASGQAGHPAAEVFREARARLK
jgi:Putative addiction module component